MGAYAEMPVRGYRGVTEGTPRSPICSLYTAMMSGYRAVAKGMGAYAEMPVRGYRGVTSGTPRSPFCSLYTAMMSGYRAVAKRRGAYAAMPLLSVFSVPSVRTLFFDLRNE